MKTLPIIQTIAKIGMIVTKVLFICCIVGFCLCLAGLVGLSLGGDVFKLGGVTIHSMIENNADLNQPTIVVSMAAAMVFCAAEAVLARFAHVYFKNELDDGTPFTQRGAKELMRLGILTAAISMAAVVLCSIIFSAARHIAPDIGEASFGEYSSVGVGITMILLSLICRCGAELIGEKTET